MEIEEDAILTFLLKNSALNFKNNDNKNLTTARNETEKNLVKKLANEWPQKQLLWDKILDEESFVWTDIVNF